MAETKCLFYYSQNPSNKQAVKCLCQFYTTVRTVQQFSHFSISLQVQHLKVMFVRQTGQPKAEFSFPHFSFSHFQRPRQKDITVAPYEL